LQVKANPGQKVSDTPISTNKLGVVACTCDPSYAGGVGKRIVVGKLAQGKTSRPYPINK
jgi:hypothetical protein